MSKEKKKYDAESDEILQDEKKFLKKKRRFKANCPHAKNSGKSRLRAVEGQEHVHECTRCRTRLDLRKFVKEADHGIGDLKANVAEVKNALEVIKYRAAIDENSKRSEGIVAFAAKMLMDIDTIPEIFEAILEETKSKKDKKKEKQREIKVGLDSLAFGKKKSKKSGW